MAIPVDIPIEGAKMKTGHGHPYLIVEACPAVSRYHPLDEWLNNVRQSPNTENLFNKLPQPRTMKANFEQHIEHGEIYGTVKLSWSFDLLDDQQLEKFRIRCEYNEFKRIIRVSLSGNSEANTKFMDQLAVEIEPYKAE